jgi:prolipoprotein diacylglyceryltransferase
VEFQRPDAWMMGPLAAAQVISILIIAAAVVILVYRHRRRVPAPQPEEAPSEPI